MCASTVEGMDGCVCGEGTVARQITAPVAAGRALRQTVVCQDSELNLISAEDLFDPCDGFSCGDNGSCMGVNGFPTCRCDDGFAAITNFAQPNGVSCVATGDIFEPNQLNFIEVGGPGDQVAPLCECASSSSNTSALFGMGLLFGLGVMVRRRRR